MSQLLKRMAFLGVISFSFLCVCSQSVKGELLGKVSLEEWLLQGQVRLGEPSQGEIRLGPSYLKWNWIYSDLEAFFLLGNNAVVNRPLWFNSSQGFTGVELGEAYIRRSQSVGTISVGLQPIFFGYEGSMPENGRDFQPSVIYQESWFPKRDLGVSYEVFHDGYGAYLAVHNGEGGVNQDNKLWLTGRWSFKTNRWFVGLSGSVAKVGGEVSNIDGGRSDIPFVQGKDAKIRLGGIFANYRNQRHNIVLEGVYGEILQEEEERGLFTLGHWDWSYSLSSSAKLLWQMEYRDPNNREKYDALRLIRFGFLFPQAYEASQVSVLATQVIQDGDKIKRNELWVNWRISPSSFRH